jgi:hypothetical protein
VAVDEAEAAGRDVEAEIADPRATNPTDDLGVEEEEGETREAAGTETGETSLGQSGRAHSFRNLLLRWAQGSTWA